MAMHAWGVAYNQHCKIYSLGNYNWVGRMHAGMTIEVQFNFTSIRIFYKRGGSLRSPPAAPVLYIPSCSYTHCMQSHM